MSLEQIVGRITRAVNLTALAGVTLLGLDTNPVPSDWSHVSKVDPEGEKRLPLAFPLYLAETSAVSVGGSRDVTPQNTEETMNLVAATETPVLHEPSGASHVTQGTRGDADYFAVPEVLNGEAEALVGTLGRGLDYVREEFGPGLVSDRLGIPLDGDGIIGRRVGNFTAGYLMNEAVFEAYIIMNPESAAAREAGVTESDLLSPEAARQRALAAEYHLGSEVVYLEYSGTFGGDEAVETLEAVDDACSWPRLWYGGGLDSGEKAERVLAAGADAVVVGDVFHDVAELEAELFDQARETFDDVPTHDRLTDWVESTVDVETVSATRYLSTIPDVDDAPARATRYLAASLEFGLACAALAETVENPSGEDISAAVAEDARLTETRLAGSLNGSQRELSRRIAGSLVAEPFDVVVENGFATRHLGISLDP
jgi:phosphoglycerol geranylgeranyltransferase